MLERLTAASLATVLMGVGQLAFAHTGVKDSATEGERVYTGFTITHGCAPDHDSPQIPVIAQSVVFPDAYIKAFKLTSTGEVPTNISNHIEGSVAGFAPTGIQDKNIFNKTEQGRDANGLLRSLHFTDGSLDVGLVGIVPFRIQAPTFKADSCAKSLKVRFAIANWCTTSQNPDDNDRVDVWIGHETALFNDPDVVSTGYWPTMTVNRDLVNNPLKPSCGDGFDVAVQPSDSAIDTRLPIKGFWPKP
ncbi:MAG: hypothetical protein ACU837_14225 [Gammaproteobacteria bacterium]